MADYNGGLVQIEAPSAASLSGRAGRLSMITDGGATSLHYLMRGWRPGTADYETWVAVGAPNSSNPSGQPITDITIQASWSS